MQIVRVVSFSTALCLAIAPLALAQSAASTPAASVPRVVRIDGQFVPANGLAPANVETVTLAIYASATDDTPLWEETQDVRVDAQGRYAIFVGATSAEGVPLAVLSSGGPRWLGIRFARPGEVEQARVPLTSVPYALRASDAETLGGLPPSAFVRAAGTDGADGADGATGKGAAGRETSPNVSTGTPNYIGKFTNAVDLTSSVLFENASKIGLGTTTPLDFLHTRFTDTTGSFTGLAVQNLGSGAASYSGMLFYDQTGALGQFQGFNNSTHEYRINNIASGGTINFMLGGSSRFRIRTDADIEIAGNIRKGAGFLIHSLGTRNAAVGLNALSNAVSSDNVAVGHDAMTALSSGNGANVAVGRLAMTANTGGQQNIGVGFAAMRDSQGSYNIAIGPLAAGFKVTGDDNIYIGFAVANDVNNVESGTLRIGSSFQNRFFASGIRGITTGVANAVTVMIDSNGQLGTVNSSRRYKEDIQDMGEASSALMKLRPVTYRYTQAFADGGKPIDYGLIAEEVEQVYPDLVAHLKNGEVETVQSHKINAMLLNEVQKQHRQIGAQQSEIAGQQRELDDLKDRLAALEGLLATDKK